MRKQIIGSVLVLGLAGCGGILPHEANVDAGQFVTYDEMMASYNGIRLGATGRAELSKLGFDTRTTPNIEVLSYSEIVDHFLPSERMTLEQAPAAARHCIEAQERCSAYVLKFQHSQTRRNGSVVPDLLGVERDTESNGWSAKITLLLQDDVVVYKELSGKPSILDRERKTEPLGPLQDLGRTLAGQAP